MRAGTTRRTAAVALCLLVALLLQVTVLPPFAWRFGAGDGATGGLLVVPDLVLLVVVAVALLTNACTGTVAGFGAGLLLDLAPPADHLVGRWALALLLVGYVVGRLAHDERDADRARLTWPLVLAAAAGGSFVGSSVYALTGLILGDGRIGVGALLGAVVVAALQDAVAALLVVPLVRRALAPRGTLRGSLVGPRGPRGPLGPLGGRGAARRPVERSWARVG